MLEMVFHEWIYGNWQNCQNWWIHEKLFFQHFHLSKSMTNLQYDIRINLHQTLCNKYKENRKSIWYSKKSIQEGDLVFFFGFLSLFLSQGRRKVLGTWGLVDFWQITLPYFNQGEGGDYAHLIDLYPTKICYIPAPLYLAKNFQLSWRQSCTLWLEIISDGAFMLQKYYIA